MPSPLIPQPPDPAAVARAARGDPAGVPGLISGLVEDHGRWNDLCLNLVASHNVVSPLDNRKPRDLEEAQREVRRVYFQQAFSSTPAYGRDFLPADVGFQRPVIVEKMGATTVVFPGWSCRADTPGNLWRTAGGS